MCAENHACNTADQDLENVILRILGGGGENRETNN